MSQFNIEFTFDGEKIDAITGQSVAAALLAANQRALRKTRFNNNERGVFCGIGVCFDCLHWCKGEYFFCTIYSSKELCSVFQLRFTLARAACSSKFRNLARKS